LAVSGKPLHRSFPQQSATSDEEAVWWNEFAKAGPPQARENLGNSAFYHPHEKRISAIRWLRKQERAQERRMRAAVWAAVAAAVIALLAWIFPRC
jgi:hypothetical protein